MKRLLVLLLMFAPAAWAAAITPILPTPVAHLWACYNMTLGYIPINASASGVSPVLPIPSPYIAAGMNTNGNAYPLQCDSNGNLILSGGFSPTGTGVAAVSGGAAGTTYNAANPIPANFIASQSNFLASDFTTASTSLVSTGLAFPVVPANSFKQGVCFVQAEIVLQVGMYFGLGADVAPAALYGSDRVVVNQGGGFIAIAGAVDSVITNTTPAIIDDAGAEWTAGRIGIYTIQVSLHTGSAPTTVTLYQEVTNGPGEVGALTGSGCSWYQ